MTEIHRYPPLLTGRLLRRYKRFLADVALDAPVESGNTAVTAFCPNSGSMRGLLEPGAGAMVSESSDPHRKTRHTLEMIKSGKTWVAVNTLLTNHLAYELLAKGLLPLRGFDEIIREVTVGDSRLDFLLMKGKRKTYLEVKSVTLRVGEQAQFPDAVTSRGKKHLEALMELRKQGHGAAMLYVVQRGDCRCFAPARDIDPAYARALDGAVKKGVKIYACSVEVEPRGVCLKGALPLCV